MIVKITIIALLLSISLFSIRAFIGPTALDRVLAINVIGTIVVVILTLLSIFLYNAFYLDIAIAYALLNFITSIGLFRFFGKTTGK